MDSWERVKGEIREAIKDWPPLVRSGVHWVTEYPLWLLAAFVGLLYWMLPDDDFWATMKFAIEVTIAVVALVFFYRRLRNQDKQVAHQIRKETDDRFTTAVNLLGSAEASARTGAIYSLYQLFIDEGGEKYRPQIAQILCSHIRTKTQEPEYQKDHKDRPSSEIQTTIDLLFKDVGGNKGIYCREDIVGRKDFPIANLQHAYLCGADFGEACCERVDFERAYCREAYFNGANCKEAKFWFADCMRINFGNAHCERANFWSANCEEAEFSVADCRGIDFQEAHCEVANFMCANCREASFLGSHCEGADFEESHCEGADFKYAHCVGASFEYAHCERADFERTHCMGANFSGVYCQDADFQDGDFRGSYALKDNTDYSSAAERIKGRVGKETELENVNFAGELNKESIEDIDEAKPNIEKDIYNYPQEIIEKNKGVPLNYTILGGMKTGVLEDSPELQQTIQKLEEIEKRKRYL